MKKIEFTDEELKIIQFALDEICYYFEDHDRYIDLDNCQRLIEKIWNARNGKSRKGKQL